MARDELRQDAPTEEGEEEDEGTPRRRRPFVLAAALVMVCLAGGAYAITANPSGADPAPEEDVALGEVVALTPITLNLSDGRFLKVGLALQLADGVAPPADADIDGYAAPALDDAISLLGAMSYEELVAPGGRDAAKESLSERIAGRYDDEVVAVYFTELVMQ